MLQQILSDMYIDPDVLAELDEESKQILFCKMREEQVRRWKEREEKLEKESKKHSQKPKMKNKGKKAVNFLVAEDGNPWVWVMGEHKDDLTIEDILEKEAREKADKEAVKEMEKLERLEQDRLSQMLEEEQKKVEAEKQKKQEEFRKQTEAAMHDKSKKKVLKEIEEKKKQEEEIIQKKMREVVRKIERIKRASISSIYEEKEKRASEIFLSLRQRKELLLKTAEQNEPMLEKNWKEQERKAKEAEAELQAIAKRARQEQKECEVLKTTDNLISSLMNISESKPKAGQQGMPTPRCQKPSSRADVVRWFQEKEEPRGAGLDPQTNQVATWFHGIISRQSAEDMLEDKKPGTFLIRLSLKIYGYVLSLRKLTRCTHFLIFVSPAGYKLSGTNQIVHPTLASFVRFYQDNPLSPVRHETLQYPCERCQDSPVTRELFAKSHPETSYL